MKKLLCLLASFLLVISLAAPALAASFSLRNGYYWGMSKDSALKLAKEERLGNNISKGDRVAAFENVKVGDFSVRMMLCFDDGLKLNSIYYHFPSLSKDDKYGITALFDSIGQALTDTYGVPVSVLGDFYARWDLGDTEIGLLTSAEHDNSEMKQCVICYKPIIEVKNSGF